MKILLWAKKNATKADVIDACKQANAYDFIMKLPQGFDTIVGEGGKNLSGGERQRVSDCHRYFKRCTDCVDG